MARGKKETNIEIPGDWIARDRHLQKLATATGFRTVNKLLTHVAYEVAACKTPANFYRALSQFFETANRKKSNR